MLSRSLLVAGAALGLAGCGGDPNVYPLTQAEAYTLLRSTKVPKGNGGLFGNLTTVISGDGVGRVYWNAGSTFTMGHCEAEITPEGNKSRIMAFCNGGSLSDGAAMGFVAGVERRALIEHIDAALTRRAYDSRRAALGATAAGWPADARQPDGSYGTMVTDALKMDHDMRSGSATAGLDAKIKEIEAQSESRLRVENPSLATRPTTVLHSSDN